MQLQVISYHPSPLNYHFCKDEDGNTHNVDLFVDSTLIHETHESIVGKTVEVSRLHPYEEIAYDVRVVGKDSNETH
jgi:hypothetical protein